MNATLLEHRATHEFSFSPDDDSFFFIIAIMAIKCQCPCVLFKQKDSTSLVTSMIIINLGLCFVLS